jgi:glucan 1,3-beta-glucosidase
MSRRGSLATAALALMVAASAVITVWWWLGRPVAIVEAPQPRFPCLSYAPYSGSQTPFDEKLIIPSEQIARDLRLLAERTDCVRTYSVDQGLAEVVPIAGELGLKVMLGVWIGFEAAKNNIEVERAVTLARRYPQTVVAMIVGNEVLLRREQPPEALAELIRRVRAAVPLPVTYADVWEFWVRHAEVAEAVDFVTIHTLPYWEDDPVGIDNAVEHVLRIVAQVAGLFPGKRIFIGEAGWPSAGRMREAALPSPVNQARFIRELISLAAERGLGLNIIESFDQPWKRRLEGTVGGHWGVYDQARRAKFSLSGPVSNHPAWRMLATASVLTGLALALSAGIRGGTRSWREWFAVAGATQAAALLLVLGGLAALDAARTAFDIAVWLSRWLLAAAAAILVTRVLASDTAACSPSPMRCLIEAVRRRRWPNASALAIALGVTRGCVLFGAAVTTLCFLFDPRYRDFPAALTVIPAAAFLILAVARPQVAVFAADDDRREELLLAVVLAVGGVVLFAFEAPWNHQAAGLMLANLLLFAAVCCERAGVRRLQPAGPGQSRSDRSKAMSRPAADVSGA